MLHRIETYYGDRILRTVRGKYAEYQVSHSPEHLVRVLNARHALENSQAQCKEAA